MKCLLNLWLLPIQFMLLALLISEGSFWHFDHCKYCTLISLLYRISHYLLSWSPKGTFETLTLSSSTYLFLLTCSPEPWRVLLALWLLPILLTYLFAIKDISLLALLISEGWIWNFDYFLFNLSLCCSGYILTGFPDLWKGILKLWLLPILFMYLFAIQDIFYMLSWTQKDASRTLTIANSTYLFAIQDISLLALLISEGSI